MCGQVRHVVRRAEEAMETIESIDLISRSSGIRCGKPCISGTSLRVTDVVMAHLLHKRTPDEIASDYEISLAQVH